MADQRQELYQVLQATKDAADSVIRTRDGEIASLQFIAEQAHSQRSPSETDTYREVQELRGEVRALSSELASSYCAHSDAQGLRQQLAASEGLMSEMFAEFQAQLQGHILDHGEKMNNITMTSTQYVEQLGQHLELELAAYETKIKGGQRYLARARQELRDGHSERGSLMGKIAASASEPAPIPKTFAVSSLPPLAETRYSLARLQAQPVAKVISAAPLGLPFSKSFMELAVRVIFMRSQRRTGSVPFLPVRVQRLFVMDLSPRCADSEGYDFEHDGDGHDCTLRKINMKTPPPDDDNLDVDGDDTFHEEW